MMMFPTTLLIVPISLRRTQREKEKRHNPVRQNRETEDKCIQLHINLFKVQKSWGSRAPNSLVQSVRWTHGRFDDQGTNVLPVLLQQRNQEVNSHQDLVDQGVFVHFDVTDGNSQTQNLLQLELDGRSDISDLLVQVVVVRDWGWELTGLRQLRTQKSWDLLDQDFGSDESVVLLSQLLNQLLVLVQLLQILNGHSIDTTGLSSVDVESVTEDTNRHVWSWADWQLQSTRETLVSLRVVVLQTDLQLNGFQKVSLLGVVGVSQQFLDVFSNLRRSNLRHDCCLFLVFQRYLVFLSGLRLCFL